MIETALEPSGYATGCNFIWAFWRDSKIKKRLAAESAEYAARWAPKRRVIVVDHRAIQDPLGEGGGDGGNFMHAGPCTLWDSDAYVAEIEQLVSRWRARQGS